MATDLKEVISEKNKLEDDIFRLIYDFQTRNKGTSVEEIVIIKANVNSCGGPEIVSLTAKVNIKSYID